MSVDPDRLLRAIAKQETRAGRNNCPRFERSFAPKGEVFTVQGHEYTGTGRWHNPEHWKRWGMAAAFSYGPWQMMYGTAASLGYLGPPWELWDEQTARPYALKLLGRIEKTQGAATVRQFADAWNSGNCKDDLVPEPYIAAVEAFYAEEA